MKIIAMVYLGMYVLSKICEVFVFGKERKPYTPAIWLAGLLLNLPVWYILYQVIIH